MTEECGEIVFWTLRKKFVASSDEMPEHSSQVMYYSLAIGHHVGVIDCLNVAFRCPLTEYEQRGYTTKMKQIGKLTKQRKGWSE